jgi:hypothetical protein
MKRLPLIALACLLLFSCDDGPEGPPPPIQPHVETHSVNDVDYIKNKFFLLDTPDDFAGARPSTLKVYMTNDIIVNPIPGWAIPDPTSSGDQVLEAVDALSTGGLPPHYLHADFDLLELGVDYSLLTVPGDTLVMGIELTIPVPPSAQRAVAVSYTSAFGNGVGGFDVDGELVLEMIKAPVPSTVGHYITTWPMVVRNAYDLGFTDINPDHFTLRIEDVFDTRFDRSRPEGSDVPYTTIFGVEPLDPHIDWERGILWMPVLDGFAPPPDSVQAWTGGAFAFSGVYLPQYETSQRIYDEELNPTEEAEVHQYVIRATLTTPAP